jgi:MYXO-CTERM domain-containing protein
MTLRVHRLVTVILTLGCSFVPRWANACGGGGITTSDAGVVANSQRVIISSRASGETDIIVEVAVPATTADYGVLIPVPSEPLLDDRAIDEDELARFDEATAPQIKRELDYPSEGSGCGCGSAGDDDSSGSDTKGASGSVSVTQQVSLGPVTAIALTGDSVDAVSNWLGDNGFVIPDDRLELLDAYVGGGRYFIAVKRDDRSTPGTATSIGLHYTLQGDYRQLSLAFARLGAAPTVAFTVFVGAPVPMGPSEPFVAFGLDDLSADLLRRDDYTGAVAKAVKSRGSRAFLVETAKPVGQILGSALIPAQSPLHAAFDDDVRITRLSSVIDAEALTEDATFDEPLRSFVSGVRTVEHRVATTTKYASTGGLVVLLLGGLLRRRRRRE